MIHPEPYDVCKDDTATEPKYRTWGFRVCIVGTGENIAEAWEDAVENFCCDPGNYDDYGELE